jgi:NTP pyrophosphatase (non-canonical NTP hydrolase)
VDFKEYQEKASSTALYEGFDQIGGLTYCTLGLTGEAGEFANKVKKILRKDKPLTEVRQELAEELGDVTWYLAELASNLGYTLEEIAEMNIRKLASRKERHVVQGSGDNR